MTDSKIPYAMRDDPNYVGLPETLVSEDHQPPQELDPVVGEWLRVIYPLRNPTVSATMAEVQREAGRQEVVDMVHRALEHLETLELCADQLPP